MSEEFCVSRKLCDVFDGEAVCCFMLLNDVIEFRMNYLQINSMSKCRNEKQKKKNEIE